MVLPFAPKRVDWMVCDMVEQPSRVLELVADWFEQGYCQFSVFNLKLPMKNGTRKCSCLDRLHERLSRQGSAVVSRTPALPMTVRKLPVSSKSEHALILRIEAGQGSGIHIDAIGSSHLE